MTSMAFGDYPEQPKQIPWKLILIIVGGVVVAAGILIGVYFATHKTIPVSTSTTSSTKTFAKPSRGTTGQTATDPCAGLTDAEACKILQMKQQAIADKKSDSCSSLKDADKDDCFWSVAIAIPEAELCKKIENADLSGQCADEINALMAIKKPDIALCDKIGNTQIKKACQAVVNVFPKGNTCDATVQNCVLDHVLSVANQMNDSGVCKVLDPKTQATCIAGVVLDDPDHDGLDSTVERVVSNTDPYNPDTDGDGYLDGAEVNSGHDPLKK